ncbi:MAG: CoA transferase, partial [Actinomycetes bacterium]
ILARRTTAEWLEVCDQHHVPATAVARLDDLVDALPEAVHPVGGRYKVIPQPTRFSATPASVRRPAPLVGQDNREVLAEAGFTDAEISQLEKDRVLRTRHGLDPPPASS